jgi:AcrR family transcriptional regulator
MAASRGPDIRGDPAAGPGDGGTVAPKQARSRRTLDRLLDATEAVLADAGLDGATVPSIAARAGLSVGVVYRRFRDKDALLRATYERFFARALEGNRAALAAERWEGVGAGAVVAAVVAGVVRGHVQHRALLRALLAYAESHHDPEFLRRVTALNAAAAAQVTVLLDARAAEIAHPEPALALGLALGVVGATLHRWIQAQAVDHGSSSDGAADKTGRGDGLLDGIDDGRLSAELTRMVTAYLGIRSMA